MTAPDRFGQWGVVAASTVLVSLWCALILAQMGPGEPGVRAIIRLTAGTSALLFSLTFAASAINRLWHGPPGRWLLRNRRYLGLSFAASHALHLAALVALSHLRGDPWLLRESGLAGLLGGGLGFLFLAAMAATSFDGAVTWMGRRPWKVLHTTGMYVLAGIFAFTYFGVVTQTGRPVAVAFLALLLTAFVLRVVALVQRRRQLATRRV